MTTRLDISLLGAFQVTLDGEPVTQFGSDTARALLAYLALHPDEPHRRDALAGLLWPEHSDSRARHNLRAALSRLRTAIGDRSADAPLLHVQRQTIQFSANAYTTVDVEVVRQAWAAIRAHEHEQLERCGPCAGLLQEVADLYRGEFLAGFSLDSAPFEEWMVVEREALHWQALEALSALAAYHENQGDYDRAIACARRQVELEPWRESAHRQWMRGLALSGHRATALAQFEACRRTLAEELGVEPEPETQMLQARIRQGELAPPPAPVQAVDLAGPAPVKRPALARAAPVPDLVPAPAEDERRVVTALSVGFVGRTAAGSGIAPELWAEVAGTALRQTADVVARYGGQTSQVRADGLVALFGAAVAHEDDPARAILAALEIKTALQYDAADLARQEGLVLHVRAGVHTGPAVVTRIGEGPAQTMTALGEVIPTAGQLERDAEPGTVLVTKQSYRLARPFFKWQASGDKHIPLARATDQQTKGRGLAGLDAPLVGREAEVRAIRQAEGNLHAGIGGIVTVVGDAGIGKSRLIAEIRSSVTATQSDLNWIEGRCLSYTTTVAYQLWLDVLHGLLGLPKDVEDEAACISIREYVHALCGDRTDEVYPYLARLMCLSPPEEEAQLGGLDAEGLRTLTFRAWETLIACAAVRHPLTLVCEDLHWADPTSLALLEHLLPLTERLPLLLVCVFRAITDHGCWRVRETVARDYRHRHTDLWLEALTEQESAELVGCLLQPLRELREDLPPELRARILEYAAGNPFYVEEILRSLIDEGILIHDETTGRWHATREPTALPLPDTLRGVLVARIDRLPLSARRTLQLASVVGRIFEQPVIERLAQGMQDLDGDLQTLQRTEMIRVRSRFPQATYIFKHQLTLEAAYESLLRRKRRALHRRVARALEQLYPERIEEQLGLLAHHWEQAGEGEQAVAYLRRAGEQAAAQFANAEAVAFFGRALDLVPEGEQEERYALLLERESALDMLGWRDAQREDLAALEALAEVPAGGRADVAGRQADVALRWAHYAIRTFDLDAAEDAARTALRHAQAAQDVRRQAAAHCQLGRAGRYRGSTSGSEDTRWVRAELEQALRLAREAGSLQIEIDVLHELAAVSADRGLEKAQRLWEEELRICREAGYRKDEGRALRDLAVAHAQQNRYAEAKRYLEQSLVVCRQTGHRRDEGWALQYLGLVYAWLGDYANGRAYSEQALRVHRETGDRHAEAQVYETLMQCAAHTDDYAGAQHWVAQAEGRQALNPGWIVWLGDLAWQQGEREDVRSQYEAAAQISRPMEFLAHLARCGLAELALAEKDPAQAEHWIAPLLEILGQPAWWSPLVELRLHLACYRVLRARGDPRAQEILDQAVQVLQERASWIDDQALRRSYLENVPSNREIAVLSRQAAQP